MIFLITFWKLGHNDFLLQLHNYISLNLPIFTFQWGQWLLWLWQLLWLLISHFVLFTTTTLGNCNIWNKSLKYKKCVKNKCFHNIYIYIQWLTFDQQWPYFSVMGSESFIIQVRFSYFILNIKSLLSRNI